MITNEIPGPSGHSQASNSFQNDASSSSVDVEDASCTHQDVQSSTIRSKSSIKSSGVKKIGRCITWADEQKDDCASRNLCEVKEFEKKSKVSEAGIIVLPWLGGTDEGKGPVENDALDDLTSVDVFETPPESFSIADSGLNSTLEKQEIFYPRGR